MIPIVRLAFVCVIAGAGTAYAQGPAPTPTPVPVPVPAAAPDESDSIVLNEVTTYSVRSGRIALSSAAHPEPAHLPDGTYANESNTVMVMLNGVIVRIESSSGQVTEISSVRMNRQRVITLTPSTNALMQLSDIRLPSGTFTSADGRSSITVVAGRPTAFTLPGSPEGD